MKQNIIKEQWDELNNNQKIKWFNIIYFNKEDSCYKSLQKYSDRMLENNILPNWTIIKELKHQEQSFGDFTEGIDADYPNIGQMIEFLGDDLNNIQNLWMVMEKQLWMIELDIDFKNIRMEHLCDALWETVKYKLK